MASTGASDAPRAGVARNGDESFAPACIPPAGNRRLGVAINCMLAQSVASGSGGRICISHATDFIDISLR